MNRLHVYTALVFSLAFAAGGCSSSQIQKWLDDSTPTVYSPPQSPAGTQPSTTQPTATAAPSLETQIKAEVANQFPKIIMAAGQSAATGNVAPIAIAGGTVAASFGSILLTSLLSRLRYKLFGSDRRATETP